jgi:hypothetical protein
MDLIFSAFYHQIIVADRNSSCSVQEVFDSQVLVGSLDYCRAVLPSDILVEGFVGIRRDKEAVPSQEVAAFDHIDPVQLNMELEGGSFVVLSR